MGESRGNCLKAYITNYENVEFSTGVSLEIFKCTLKSMQILFRKLSRVYNMDA
jgi:hypothetical protein